MKNSTEMSKFNVTSILLIPIVWFFCNAAVAPTLGAMGQHFTEASDFQLKLIYTITGVTSVMFSVISGKLAKHFDKKNLIMLGLFIYGVAGISTSFGTSVNQLLILRLITGVGAGLVLPLPGAIVAENFVGEKRARLLGLCTATANIANVVTSIVVGIILTFGWQYPFYTFGISFVLMLTTLVGVPKSPPIQENEIKTNTEKESEMIKEQLSGNVYLLALFMTLAFMTHVVLISNLSMFWVREKIGPTGIMGLVLSLSALASIVSGSIYPELVRLFRKYLTFAALVLFGISFILIYNAHSMTGVIIGNLLEGLGFGALVPLIFDTTAKKVKSTQKDFAFGVVSSCMHLGGALSPFAQLLYSTIGSNSSMRFLFLVCAIELFIAAVIALVVANKKNM